MKEYYVFAGSFGSGKSELALNLATRKAIEHPPCTLADLDLINPYFRSSERFELLQDANVRLISPPFALDKIEIMSLSPEVYSAFAQNTGTVIFDSGGDPIGAVPLGQFHSHFSKIPQKQLHVLMVINPFRPLTETAEKAMALMEQIQSASRLNISGLINNANLAGETTFRELKTGYDVVHELSDLTGIPVYATAGMERVLDDFIRYAHENNLDFHYIGRPFPIDVVMHRTWDKFLKEGL